MKDDERLKDFQNIRPVAWNGQKLKPVTPAAINRGDRQVSDIPVKIRE